jgi:hypothetical protein
MAVLKGTPAAVLSAATMVVTWAQTTGQTSASRRVGETDKTWEWRLAGRTVGWKATVWDDW